MGRRLGYFLYVLVVQAFIWRSMPKGKEDLDLNTENGVHVPLFIRNQRASAVSFILYQQSNTWHAWAINV